MLSSGHPFSFLTAILHRGLRNDFFFQFQFTSSNFHLDFYFPSSLWTFISLFSLDFYFPFLFGLTWSKQFCSPREGNPGNMLLTSRNRLKYFYQSMLSVEEQIIDRAASNNWIGLTFSFWFLTSATHIFEVTTKRLTYKKANY